MSDIRERERVTQGRWAKAGWAAAVALALLLITTNVRISANSLWLYEQLFERNHVPARTGFSMETLRDIGQQIQDYFGSDIEPLEVIAPVRGQDVSLFGPDEVSHMADVKVLFNRTYLVQTLSALLVLIVAGTSYYKLGSLANHHVVFWMQRGTVIAASVIVIIGLASVVAFKQVFLLFHYIGFPQGNFTFNPTTDYLVRVFPNGFWEDITFVIGAMTLVEAALLWAGVRGFRLWRARRRAA